MNDEHTRVSPLDSVPQNFQVAGSPRHPCAGAKKGVCQHALKIKMLCCGLGVPATPPPAKRPVSRIAHSGSDDAALRNFEEQRSTPSQRRDPATSGFDPGGLFVRRGGFSSDKVPEPARSTARILTERVGRTATTEQAGGPDGSSDKCGRSAGGARQLYSSSYWFRSDHHTRIGHPSNHTETGCLAMTPVS